MTTPNRLGFDRATGELTGPHGDGRLAPQPAQALGLLLDAEGELVSREQLIETIWPGERFGVSDRLTYCIHQLREALDGVGLHGAVETLPRRGYRLVAPRHAAAAAVPVTVRRQGAAWPVMVALLVLMMIAGLAPRWGAASDATDHRARHAEQHGVTAGQSRLNGAPRTDAPVPPPASPAS